MESIPELHKSLKVRALETRMTGMTWTSLIIRIALQRCTGGLLHRQINLGDASLLDFADLFYVCSTNTLMQEGWLHRCIGAL